MKKRHIQKLLLISAFLLLAFNLPLVLLFNSSEAVLGFPVIYVYFFSVWLFSAIMSFAIFKRFDE
ncbi:MAG: hypothetical protein EOO50_06210 [Flavobacterium sp.]|uniref:hypothetical protein n=1 Tax=Flavobacterium sp. TaxID=239 RepID=UPI001212556A|nr:hypothetical protein [Flavobacterium sp.]RZJ67336.1 MAG: hypothetical protein EOO50_06210 [Flavobacterium sp.]